MDGGNLDPPVAPLERSPDESGVVPRHYYELVAVLHVRVRKRNLRHLLSWDRWDRGACKCCSCGIVSGAIETVLGVKKGLQEGLLVLLTVIQAVTQAIDKDRIVLILVLLGRGLHENLLKHRLLHQLLLVLARYVRIVIVNQEPSMVFTTILMRVVLRGLEHVAGATVIM